METIKTTIETITPAMAAEYLKRNVVNRKIYHKAINLYASDMATGQWKLDGEAIKFDEKGRMIDGQHRLTACVQCGKPFTTVVMRGLPEDSFITLDSGKGRSSGDVLTIMEVPNANNIAAGITRYIGLCEKSVIMRGSARSGGGSKRSRQYVVEIYNRTPEFWQRVYSRSSTYYRASQVLVLSEYVSIYAYLVLQKMHSEESVNEFFEKLADIQPCEYVMLRKCRQMLIKDKKDVKTNLIGSVRQALLIKAWNYFIQKKDVQHFQYNPEFDKNIWFK